MKTANAKLKAAVETCFADLARIYASGGATGERSSYGPYRRVYREKTYHIRNIDKQFLKDKS